MSQYERIRFWGPPGTGKTSRLIGIVNDELDHGVKPDEIIYTSFTRAACNEAIRKALMSSEVHYKKEDFPWFRTEHAICFKLLGLKKDYVFTDERLLEFSDKYPTYKFTASRGYSFQERHNETMLQSLGDYYEFFISWMDNRVMPFEDAIKQFIKEQRDLPSEFSISGATTYTERREAFKQENSLWDFNDMIYNVTQRGLCPKAKVLIFDEAQDAGKNLYKLIALWAKKAHRTYIAGDKFQAIYLWAGSDPELFDQFEGDLEVLPHSHRLPPEIKDYARRILALANLQLPDFSAADRVGEIKTGQMNTIDWLQLAKEGQGAAKGAFVLARTRGHLKELGERLKLMGVPFAMERLDESPLECSKGEAYLTLLKLQAKERVNADELRALAQHTRQPWLVYGAKTRIKNLVQAEYDFKDIAHFFTQDFVDTLPEDISAILCKDMDEGDKSYLRRVYKKCGVTAFMKKPDIVLTTIHGSKGREKETVVISPEMGRRVYDSFLINKQSEVFVAYVAATRSMKRIIMLPRETPESFPYPRLNGAKED